MSINNNSFRVLYLSFMASYRSIYESKRMTDEMFSSRYLTRYNELSDFREKNNTSLAKISGKYKDLTKKQISLHQKEDALLTAASNSAGKWNDHSSMYFIRLWLEFEAYQIDLITNFLLLNDDSLKTIIKKSAKGIKGMPENQIIDYKLKSAHWNSYFNKDLNEAARFDYVKEFVAGCTRGGVIDRQKMFNMIGVKISPIVDDAIKLLQRMRNMIIHEKSILNNESYEELKAFVKNHRVEYNKRMRILADQRKSKDTKKLEDNNVFDSSYVVIYRIFKLMLRDVTNNKKIYGIRELKIYSSTMDSILAIIIKDFFNKTYQILNLSDFDFGFDDDTDKTVIVSLDNNIRHDFLYEYLFNLGELYTKESESLLEDKNKKSISFRTFKAANDASNLFRVSKFIFIEQNILDKKGFFRNKSTSFKENLIRVNLSALTYYEFQLTNKAAYKPDVDKKYGETNATFKKFILNTIVFQAIKHNDQSKLFDPKVDHAKEGVKACGLNFKIAKHLLLGELDEAIQTLYECEDLNEEILNSVKSWPLSTELNNEHDFIELLKSYNASIEKSEEKEQLIHVPETEEQFEA